MEIILSLSFSPFPCKTILRSFCCHATAASFLGDVNSVYLGLVLIMWLGLANYLGAYIMFNITGRNLKDFTLFRFLSIWKHGVARTGIATSNSGL